MQTRIPLLIAFTPSYIVPAATTLLSVLESSPETARYEVICMLSQALSDEHKHKLSLIDGGSGRLSFRYIEIKEEELEGGFVDPKYTLAANFRLIIADKLPDIKIAIYTDCDIIIRQDLSKLYHEIELGDNYLAGVVEATTALQTSGILALGCRIGEYINSGFLVMNLELLRRDNMSQRFLEALRVPYLTFPDQDVLNAVCLGRILFLPPWYNGMRSFMHKSHRALFLKHYTMEDWHRVQREGNIHYTSGKPWREYAVGLEKWWQTYWRLPQAVRQGFEHNRKIECLARILSIPGVRPLADLALRLRRKLGLGK